MDLTKTQFLVEDHGTHRSIRLFKRKRIGMLFDRNGPVRPISWDIYQKLVKDWPDECAADGVRYETVWGLVPHEPKASKRAAA